MDISGISSIAASADVSSQHSIIMAKKAQDHMRQEGDSALRMIESASQVARSSPTIGSGVVTAQRVDVYA